MLPLSLLVAALVPVLPADAATVCTVSFPTRVIASKPLTYAPPSFTGCEGVAKARWNLFDSSGTRRGRAIGVDNGASIGSWIFSDKYPIGHYKVVPVATAGVQQNSTATVVKYGTTISLKGYRQDHLKVPLSGTVKRYVASVDGYRGWANRFVSISYRDCTTCAWHPLYSDRTDAHGVFSLAAVSDQVRYYRARIGDTTAWWGSTSNSVHY